MSISVNFKLSPFLTTEPEILVKVIPFISEKFQYSFMLQERMYNLKELVVMGMRVVQPGKQEGAERSGQVSL